MGFFPRFRHLSISRKSPRPSSPQIQGLILVYYLRSGEILDVMGFMTLLKKKL